MKIESRAFRRQSACRAGFTLVELLVVMAIIAALAALTVSASMRIITVQDEANTKTLVKKVHSVLEKHWQAVIDKAFKEPFPTVVKDNLGSVLYTNYYQQVLLPMATGNSNENPVAVQQRARVLYVKMRLRQEFPMTLDEFPGNTIFGSLPTLPTYYQAMIGQSFSNRENENSALLLLALSQAQGGIQFNRDDLGPNALANLENTGNTVREIVDSWGQPIIFFRWPTVQDVDALNPGTTPQQQTFRDPQDPTGLLYNQDWWSIQHNKRDTSGNKNGFEYTWGHSLSNPITSDNKYEYYMVPVVVSAGPDKNFGINPYVAGKPWAMEPINGSSAASDNIYSYNLR